MNPMHRIARSWFSAFCFVLAMFVVVMPARAQTAAFAGTVLVDPTEKPLANAEILFPGLNRSVRSDSVGNFLFSGLPLGKHAVTVKLIGYESINTEVALTNGRPVSVDLLLKPSSTKLATVVTKATATKGPWAIKLQEFDERRATGSGRYLTAEYFEQKEGSPLSAFLREKIPGITILQAGGGRFLASARGCPNATCGGGTHMGERLPKACYVKVIVNGIVRYGNANQGVFDIDELNARDIIGLEFYTTATTPAQYNGTTATPPCGTLIVWTKGG